MSYNKEIFEFKSMSTEPTNNVGAKNSENPENKNEKATTKQPGIIMQDALSKGLGSMQSPPTPKKAAEPSSTPETSKKSITPAPITTESPTATKETATSVTPAPTVSKPEAAPPAPIDIPPSSEPSGTPTIALVEDDKFISRAYKDGLENAGFKVTISNDDLELHQQLKKEIPDLIILDLILPRKDGFEILEELKLDENLKNIPVIILSNLGQESDVEKGKALGAVDYLIKANVTMKDVIQKIKYHLVQSRS